MAKPITGLTAAARAAGMPGGGYVPTGQITWLMGRVHVGTSGLTIARDIWRRAAKFPRPIKRAMVRAALRAHGANRDLYRAVRSGRF